MKIFSGEPIRKPNTNIFDLSHDRKFSMDFGRLVPVLVQETVPGDTFRIEPSILIRFAPLVNPVMHSISAYVHYFYVPNRIVWPNFPKFISKGEDGEDNTVWPYFNVDLSAGAPGDLADYLGLPVGADVADQFAIDISGIPFAAYQKIYDEYYRDQNLIDSDYSNLIDGANSITGKINIRTRAWGHDYFTSALPETQKGPEALLPLVGEAPVYGDDSALAGQNFLRFSSTGNKVTTTADLQHVNTAGQLNQKGSGQDLFIDLNGTNYAKLSEATSTSIIELRRAVALQSYLEANARGGGRYTEWLKVHFGVSARDQSIQRPTYLGGVQVPVKVSEVLQTSETSATPQGTPTGHAVGVAGGKPVGYWCEEHGYIIGIMSVRPLTAYQQGVPKHFQRKDPFDYFTPKFQHIGEEAILQQELYLESTSEDDVFGYTPRYSSYKFNHSTVHGLMRTSLDKYHLGRKFATKPVLNQDFIECDPDEMNRIFAVEAGDNDKLWCHVHHKIMARRPMAYFGTPKFI